MADSVDFSAICPLPWVHLSANSDTSLRVCCNTNHGGFIKNESGNKIYLSDLESPTDIVNLPFMKDFRKRMIAGEKLEFCRGCYQVEENGAQSIRQQYLDHYRKSFLYDVKDTQLDGTIQPRIRYVDFSMSNHCNLKCRMCDPHSSFILKREFEELELPYDKGVAERAKSGWEMNQRFENLIEKILPTLEEILTTGGEPFLSKSHLKLLEMAVDSKFSRRITLKYHTNLTLLPERLLDLWSNFKRIELHPSIEATGRLNEYIRSGSKWETIVSNFTRLIEAKKHLPLWIEVHTCFQAYNLFAIPDLLEFLSGFEDRIPAMPHFIWLSHPPQLSSVALPPSLRIQAITAIRKSLEDRRNSLSKGTFKYFNMDKSKVLQSHLTTLERAPFDEDLWEKFLNYSHKIDVVRSEKLSYIVPQLAAESL